MAEDHEAYQSIALEVTGKELFTWTGRPDKVKYACVEGRFSRNPDVLLEIWCVNKPSQNWTGATK
jgi:hypothetical protein